MRIQAVSVDELTGGGPVVVFTPTIADACLGCGALLADCFARRGAFVITTLDATAPTWMTREPGAVRVMSRRASGWRTKVVRFGKSDPMARTVQSIGAATLSISLPLSRRSAARYLPSGPCPRTGTAGRRTDAARAAASRTSPSCAVRWAYGPCSCHSPGIAGHDTRVSSRWPRPGYGTWTTPFAAGATPVGGHGTTQGSTVGPDRLIRTLDTTPWRSAKREALARMDAAGFDLSAVTGPTVSGHDRADRIAGSPERYLRSPEA